MAGVDIPNPAMLDHLGCLCFYWLVTDELLKPELGFAETASKGALVPSTMMVEDRSVLVLIDSYLTRPVGSRIEPRQRCHLPPTVPSHFRMSTKRLESNFKPTTTPTKHHQATPKLVLWTTIKTLPNTPITSWPLATNRRPTELLSIEDKVFSSIGKQAEGVLMCEGHRPGEMWRKRSLFIFSKRILKGSQTPAFQDN